MSILKWFRRKPEALVIQDELGTFLLEHPQSDRFYEGTVPWPPEEALVDLEIDGGEPPAADAAAPDGQERNLSAAYRLALSVSTGMERSFFTTIWTGCSQTTAWEFTRISPVKFFPMKYADRAAIFTLL